MLSTRRSFLELSAIGFATTLASASVSAQEHSHQSSTRRFRFVQIDVFTSKRLQGNPLAVFLDARGLTDAEMQDLARETNLQETTFILPRDSAIERERGVRVRIFASDGELPFAGHPSLGTAMVVRTRRLRDKAVAAVPDISLDLNVGKIPVAFTNDASGAVVGEMQQIEPTFGRIHEREAIAALAGISVGEISDEGPIQTVSTGLPFAIVPLKNLKALQSVNPDLKKIRSYFEGQGAADSTDLYYITRDTQDSTINYRARGIFSSGEDPATGSAAGCAASWLVRHGAAKSGEIVRIVQGVEAKRPSQIIVRAERHGDRIVSVRVAGHAVEVMEGEYFL